MDYVGTLTDQVQGMLRGLIAALPSFAIALVILLGTWIIAKFAVRIVDAMTGRTTLRPSLEKLVDTLAKLVIWITGFLIALMVVLPGMTPASLIAGLGIGAVAIAFAFQDIFENFLVGVLIMLREKMRIGDIIECEGITGKVEHITLRETHVRKLSGELTIVPNSILFKNPVEILTDETGRRHEVICGVSYDTDLDRAAEVIEKTVRGVDGLALDKGVDFFAVEFNSSSVDFKLRRLGPALDGKVRTRLSARSNAGSTMQGSKFRSPTSPTRSRNACQWAANRAKPPIDRHLSKVVA